MIDLRLNGGGDVYPMLLALGGFLDGGRVLGFRGRSGSTTWIDYRDDALYLGDERVMAASGTEPTTPASDRVALLVGPETASSGEAVVVALDGRPETRTFGLATAGETVAVGTYPIHDGRSLELSSAYDLDRNGHAFRGPIGPDTVIRPYPSNLDQALVAAETWARPSSDDRRLVEWASISLLVVLACGHAVRFGLVKPEP